MTQGVVRPTYPTEFEVYAVYANGNRGRVYIYPGLEDAKRRADILLAAGLGLLGEVQIWQVRRTRVKL